MPIPTFNIHKYREHTDEAKVQKLVEQATAHVNTLRDGAHRNEARMAQYDTGPVAEVVDYITKSLATPANHREWKKIIDHGKTLGFDGLTRSDMYKDFQRNANEHLVALGGDYAQARQNLSDALRPENMTHFLGDRIGATDPNPRDSLQKLLARHISPTDTQALADAQHAEGYRRHLLREADGQVPQAPRM